MKHRAHFAALAAIFLSAGPACAQTSAPSPAAAAGQRDDSGLRFAYGGDVAQVPAQFVFNLVLLPVSINHGEPSLFLLDSTSPTSSIDPARAASLGLQVDAGTSTINNVVLSLPGMEWEAPVLGVKARDGLPPLTGHTYQGTLGLDFLSHVVVGIDYTRRALQVYDPRSYALPNPQPPIEPVKWSNGLPLISLKFSVKGERSESAYFMIDTTQAAGIVFRDSYVSAHKKDFDHMKTIQGMYAEESGGVPAAIGRLNLFGMEKYELPNLLVTFPHAAVRNDSDGSEAGSIGAAYLRRFVLVMDFPHQQVILDPNIHFVDREDADMSGLTVLARGPNHKRFEIAFVSPGSPAFQAGLHVGDVIEAANDEAAAELTRDQLQDIFHDYETNCKLLIDRDGKTITVSFRTRRMI